MGRAGVGSVPETLLAHTVTFAEASAADAYFTSTDDPNANYSDHRAIVARIYY